MAELNSKNIQRVLGDIRRNDLSNFSKNISCFDKMQKEITKECIKLQRWDMLQEWSNYNLKIKKHWR